MVGSARGWLKGYPHLLEHHGTTLHLQASLPRDTTQAFKNLIEQQPNAKRMTAPLACDLTPLYVKRERLDSLKKKWRIHRARAKRDGTYDWVLEELINTREAHLRGAPVPEMIGYGYSRSRLGLLKDFFLITRRLTGHVDGFTLLRHTPGAVEHVIASSFELLHTLHGLGICHMDLWAGNVMLADEGVAHAIDMENSFLTPAEYLAETLGFQFGFFYLRETYRYITEAEYDAQVAQALERYFPGIDRGRFAPVYDIAKHESIGRMKRRAIFHKGMLKSRWS